MTSFCETVAGEGITYTENGAITYAGTGNPLLDFFFMAPAMRNDNSCRIYHLFLESFKYYPEGTLRTLFYIRDVRGGQGERDVFRRIVYNLQHMQMYPDLIPQFYNWLKDNIHLIPEYGRWDDVFPLVAIPKVRDEAAIFIRRQFSKDTVACNAGQPVSLLAKWLPSENASSDNTRQWARVLRDILCLTPRVYRKALSKLRNHIRIVENNLRTKDYNSIDYSTVPGKAMLKYRKAFLRNDKEHYENYLEAVNSNRTTMKTGTLYPHEIIHALRVNVGNPEGLNTMWKTLPDYVDNISGLVVADTSGSMTMGNLVVPIDVSIALAMYIAERNKNEAFKDYFISFSEKPKFHKIKGDTLKERIRSVNLGDIANTNLQKVFDLILARAEEYGIPQEDMPKMLLIISDMEFDEAVEDSNYTNLEIIREKYKNSNYEMPTLVFWNVNSRNDQVPARINDKGVLLLSGCNPVILKYALSASTDMMAPVRAVIDSDRYAQIRFL